ncbi:Transcription factor vib-1 [Smittium culicis]|uniref:Transcription factor vib-1 n=1 Tax=Smittium culicis TaxID=133412 RepID=A0A1R1Y9M9_9FUNG|nr:Transcription factor vib-1 [Smittium culicis]
MELNKYDWTAHQLDSDHPYKFHQLNSGHPSKFYQLDPDHSFRFNQIDPDHPSRFNQTDQQLHYQKYQDNSYFDTRSQNSNLPQMSRFYSKSNTENGYTYAPNALSDFPDNNNNPAVSNTSHPSANSNHNSVYDPIADSQFFLSQKNNSNLPRNDPSNPNNYYLDTLQNYDNSHHPSNGNGDNQNQNQNNPRLDSNFSKYPSSINTKFQYDFDSSKHDNYYNQKKSQSNERHFINFTNTSKSSQLPPDIFDYSDLNSTLSRRRKTMDQFMFPSSDIKAPFFSETKPSKYVIVNSASANTKHAYPKIRSKIDRGFFLSSGEWTCYRRNYFQISSSFELVYETPNNLDKLVDKPNSELPLSSIRVLSQPSSPSLSPLQSQTNDLKEPNSASKNKGKKLPKISSKNDDKSSIITPSNKKIKSESANSPTVINPGLQNIVDTDAGSLQTLSLIDPDSPNQSPELIVRFTLGISALAVLEDPGNSSPPPNAKTVELIQHTPKRDKGPQITPPKLTIVPTDLQNHFNNAQQGIHQSQYSLQPSLLQQQQQKQLNTQSQHSPSSPSINTITSSSSPSGSYNTVCFERLQFKTATANNGKRRAAQQYYKLKLTLYAELKDGRNLDIACILSAPLVVRGRSPSHYSDATSPSPMASSSLFPSSSAKSIRFHNTGLPQIDERSISTDHNMLSAGSTAFSQSNLILPPINKSLNGDSISDNAGSNLYPAQSTATAINDNSQLPPPLSTSSSGSVMIPHNSANITSAPLLPIINTNYQNFSSANNGPHTATGTLPPSLRNSSFSHFMPPPNQSKHDSGYQQSETRLANESMQSLKLSASGNGNGNYSPNPGRNLYQQDLPKISSFSMPDTHPSYNKNRQVQLQQNVNINFSQEELVINAPNKLTVDTKNIINENDGDNINQLISPAYNQYSASGDNTRAQNGRLLNSNSRLGLAPQNDYVQTPLIFGQPSNSVHINNSSENDGRGDLASAQINEFSDMISSIPIPLVNSSQPQQMSKFSIGLSTQSVLQQKRTFSSTNSDSFFRAGGGYQSFNNNNNNNDFARQQQPNPAMSLHHNPQIASADPTVGNSSDNSNRLFQAGLTRMTPHSANFAENSGGNDQSFNQQKFFSDNNEPFSFRENHLYHYQNNNGSQQQNKYFDYNRQSQSMQRPFYRNESVNSKAALDSYQNQNNSQHQFYQNSDQDASVQNQMPPSITTNLEPNPNPSATSNNNNNSSSILNSAGIPDNFRIQQQQQQQQQQHFSPDDSSYYQRFDFNNTGAPENAANSSSFEANNNNNNSNFEDNIDIVSPSSAHPTNNNKSQIDLLNQNNLDYQLFVSQNDKQQQHQQQ